MNNSFPDTVAQFVHFFEHLQATDVQRLDRFYAHDARFTDPFNEVQGLSAIQAIFAHMFTSLQQPHFKVTACICEGDQCFLRWDFFFAQPRLAQGQLQCIHGATHCVFARDAEGQWRVTLHRDYWDAAQELYEKLPVVGSLMRWLKRRFRT